jgi:hypothetical protein
VAVVFRVQAPAFRDGLALHDNAAGLRSASVSGFKEMQTL